MEPALVVIDAFSALTVALEPGGRARASQPDRSVAAIENDRYRVEASGTGRLTVIDTQAGRRFEGLHAIEDELDMGDLYNFCPVPGDAVWRSDRAAVRVLTDGPIISELEIRIEADRPAGLDAEFGPLDESQPLRVSTVVRLVRGSGRVAFRTTIDNANRDHRLRAVFAAGAAEGPVRAEGHFALVRRPLRPPEPRAEWAEPPDATQHTLGAVALGPVAVVGKGLPEYEARIGEEGVELCLTLLRCTGIISQRAGVMTTRPHSAGPQLRTPEGQCLGRHEVEYALVPNADALDDLALLRESQDYRHPFPSVPGRVQLDSALALEGDVVLSCLKGAEDGDGVILRCFNPSDSVVSARVVGDVVVSRTRLDETGDQVLADGVARVEPGQIATLRLRATPDERGA